MLNGHRVKTHCQVAPALGQLFISVWEEYWHNLPDSQGAFWYAKFFTRMLEHALLSATLMLIALFWTLQVDMVSDESLVSFIYL